MTLPSYYTKIPLPEDIQPESGTGSGTSSSSNTDPPMVVEGGVGMHWNYFFSREARQRLIDDIANGDLVVYGWTVWIVIYATAMITMSSIALVYFYDTHQYACAFYQYSCFVLGISVIQFVCVFFFENHKSVDYCTNSRCMLGFSVCVTSFASMIILGLFAYSMDVYITSDDVDHYPQSFFIFVCVQMFHLFCYVVYNICLCKRW